ncbi:hypothetical protein [Actinoplanes sp. NPDC049265]|uniref:hypothetical protein n=1 Tax=Actinoplanes sp. NPDC049265 TaxID=3363902 RepID=UPI0037155CDC
MSDGTFFAYIALLVVSGAILAVLGLGGFGQSKGARIIDGVFAAAFVAYAGYLLFAFDGGTVIISYYAFIVPILAIVQMFKARKAKRQMAAETAVPAEQPAPATNQP